MSETSLDRTQLAERPVLHDADEPWRIWHIYLEAHIAGRSPRVGDRALCGFIKVRRVNREDVPDEPHDLCVVCDALAGCR